MTGVFIEPPHNLLLSACSVTGMSRELQTVEKIQCACLREAKLD